MTKSKAALADVQDPYAPLPSPPQSDAPALPDAPPAVTLDDLQNTATPAPTPEADVQAAPAEPMSEEQILGLIGFLSSMGLAPDAVNAYQQDLANNMLLKMFLPMLDLPSVLAKYGLGSGVGGPMPEWLRGVLGVGLVGYVVVTTRSQYANRPTKQTDPIDAAGSDIGADSVPAGFSANLPSGLGTF